MKPEPEFLSVEDVLQIHDEQLAAYGGATGIRDQGLLESAVAMPQASGSGSIRGCQREIVTMQKQTQTNLVHLL